MLKNLFFAATCSLLVFGTTAPAQNKGNAEKGKEVYEQCGVCHAHDTEEKKLGPSLKGLYKKGKMTNGQKVTDQTVMEIINKGKGTMPGFDEVLSAEEKADLLAYLKTL